MQFFHLLHATKHEYCERAHTAILSTQKTQIAFKGPLWTEFQAYIY